MTPGSTSVLSRHIAHKEIDLKNWKSNQKNSGFLSAEREGMTKVFGEMGFVKWVLSNRLGQVGLVKWVWLRGVVYMGLVASVRPHGLG